MESSSDTSTSLGDSDTDTSDTLSQASDVSSAASINVPKSNENHCELDDHLKGILHEHAFALEHRIINKRLFVDIIDDIRTLVLSKDNDNNVLFEDKSTNDSYSSIFIDTTNLHSKFSGFDIFDMNPEFLVNTVVPFLLNEIVTFIRQNAMNEIELMIVDRIDYENEFKNQSTTVKIQRLSNLMKDIYTNGIVNPTDGRVFHLSIYTRNKNIKSSSQIVFWNPFLIKYTEYLLNTSLGKGPANDVIYILQNVFNTSSPRIMEKYSFIRYIMKTLSKNNNAATGIVMNEANKLFIYNLLNDTPPKQAEYKNMQEMSRTIDRIKREKGYNTLTEIWTESRSLAKVNFFLIKTLPRLDSIVDKIFNVGSTSFVNLNKVGPNFFIASDDFSKSLFSVGKFDENDLLIKKYELHDEIMTELNNNEPFVYNTSSVYELFNMQQLVGDISDKLQNAYEQLELSRRAFLKKTEEYDLLRIELNTKTTKCTNDINALTLEKTILNQKIIENNQEKTLLDTKINQLTVQLTTSEQLTNQQQLVYAQQKRECENNIAILSLEKDKLNTKVTDITTKINQLQTELNEAQTLIETYLGDITDLVTKNTDQQKKILEISKYELENKKLTDDKKQMKEQNLKLAQERNEALSRVAIQKTQYDQKLNEKEDLLKNVTSELNLLKQKYIDQTNICKKQAEDLLDARSKLQQQSPTKVAPPKSPQQPPSPQQQLSPEEQRKLIMEDKVLEELYNNDYNELDLKPIISKLKNGLSFSYKNIKGSQQRSVTVAYISRVISLLQKYRLFDLIYNSTNYKSKKDKNGKPASVMSFDDYQNMVTPIYTSAHFAKLLNWPAFGQGSLDLFNSFKYTSDLKQNYASHENGGTMPEINALSKLLSVLNDVGSPTVMRKDWDASFPDEISSNSSSNFVDASTVIDSTTTNPSSVLSSSSSSSISTPSMSKVAANGGDTISSSSKSVVSTLFSWDDWN